MLNLPDKYGHFDKYGGCFVPESLMSYFSLVSEKYHLLMKDESFIQEFNTKLSTYSQRPTPFYFAKRFSEKIGGGKIYLKREDLNHTQSLKIINAVGQILVAKKMDKKVIVTETASGLGGVAVASVAASLGMQCKVFMGKKDIKNQSLNAMKIDRLGAELIAINSGSANITASINELLLYLNDQDVFWVSNSAYGPAPYPEMTRDFLSLVGYEICKQTFELEHRQPDYLIVPLAVGSSALGTFNSKALNLIAVTSENKVDHYSDGVLHGTFTKILKDPFGNAQTISGISAEMCYPGLAPELMWLKDNNHLQIVTVSEQEAVDAYKKLALWEGIVCSIESAHALAQVMKIAKTLDKDKIIVTLISGSGDKDLLHILNRSFT